MEEHSLDPNTSRRSLRKRDVEVISNFDLLRTSILVVQPTRRTVQLWFWKRNFVVEIPNRAAANNGLQLKSQKSARATRKIPWGTRDLHHRECRLLRE